MVNRSVFGGALASVGVGALLSPALVYVLLIASLVALLDRWLQVPISVELTVFALGPVLVAIGLASLFGGYFAGAIAGRERARHGAIAALAGLTAMLVAGFGFGLVNAELLGLIAAIGAIAAIPVAIVFGRMGAMLAPRSVVASAEASPRTATVVPRRRYRLLPAVGRKGGQRMDDGEPAPPQH
jgi:hypothetical protein